MKKIAVLFLAIIISLCAVSSAVAAKWVEAYRDSEFLIYVDVSSLQYNGSIIRVWEKWIYRNENFTKNFSKDLKQGDYSLQHRGYDINNRTSILLAVTIYDKNGYPLRSIGDTYKADTIPPDTVGDCLLKFYKKSLGIQ